MTTAQGGLMTRRLVSMGICVLLTMGTGCVNTPQLPLATPLQAAAESPDEFTLRSEVTLRAPHARATILQAGTHWVEAGIIEHGTVYRTRDQVVIVNSFEVNEAWVVISHSQAVGYYLPVRRTFVATEPVSLQQERPDR